MASARQSPSSGDRPILHTSVWPSQASAKSPEEDPPCGLDRRAVSRGAYPAWWPLTRRSLARAQAALSPAPPSRAQKGKARLLPKCPPPLSPPGHETRPPGSRLHLPAPLGGGQGEAGGPGVRECRHLCSPQAAAFSQAGRWGVSPLPPWDHPAEAPDPEVRPLRPWAPGHLAGCVLP